MNVHVPCAGSVGLWGGSSHARRVESRKCVMCGVSHSVCGCGAGVTGVRTVWTNGAWSRAVGSTSFELCFSFCNAVACVCQCVRAVPFCITRCSSRALRSKTRATPTVTARSRKVPVFFPYFSKIPGFALAIISLHAPLSRSCAPRRPRRRFRVRQTCFGRLPSACDEAAAW